MKRLLRNKEYIDNSTVLIHKKEKLNIYANSMNDKFLNEFHHRIINGKPIS